MKKWLFISFVVTLFIIWQVISYYQKIMEPEFAKQQKAAAIAKETFDLVQISDVEHYFGQSQALQVVTGKTVDGTEQIVWVPDSGDPLSQEASQGWSKQQVEQFIQDSENPKKIVDIRLGLEGKSTPIWEIIYIDQGDRYTYHYLNFNNGTNVQTYRLQST
jgi:uncharacterized protein YpmB